MPEIRSLNTVPSFKDEDEFPDYIFLDAPTSVPAADEARAREARVLEFKVAQVASRGCSVEELTTLKQEVDRWLTEVTAADTLSSSSSLPLTLPHPQSTALVLSSLLLKAILANHVLSSDAPKAANESLKLKVDELELEKGRLEVELHK
jgi:hypothetical protein